MGGISRPLFSFKFLAITFRKISVYLLSMHLKEKKFDNLQVQITMEWSTFCTYRKQNSEVNRYTFAERENRSQEYLKDHVNVETCLCLHGERYAKPNGWTLSLILTEIVRKSVFIRRNFSLEINIVQTVLKIFQSVGQVRIYETQHFSWTLRNFVFREPKYCCHHRNVQG